MPEKQGENMRFYIDENGKRYRVDEDGKKHLIRETESESGVVSDPQETADIEQED